MINRFFRKLQITKSSQPFTRARKFTHERLEPRMMLTINAEGDEFLVNDEVPGNQGAENSTMSVAVSESAGTLITYSGFGAGTRDSVFLAPHRRVRHDSRGRASEHQHSRLP